MEQTPPKSSKERVGRLVRITTILGAALSLLTAILVTDHHPRTDDASVRANFIEVTAEVNGKLVALPVKDNAFVKRGDLLFEIDPRPYAYALQQALSDQEALEQQIVDAKRKIASEKSAVEAATAAEFNSKTGIKPPAAVWMSPAPLSIAPKQTWSLRKPSSPMQPITCTGCSPCSKNST